MNIDKFLKKTLDNACSELEFVCPNLLLSVAKSYLHNTTSFTDLFDAMIMSSRIYIEVEPNYTYVAARLLLQSLRKQISNYYGCDHYHDIFSKSIITGVKQKLLNKKLLSYDLEYLSRALQPSRDLKFNYIGMQSLYDRYLLRDQESILELPQVFFMRVAMGISFKEENKHETAIALYNALSNFDFMLSTPMLFNSGTVNTQLTSGCMVTIPDDLVGICDSLKHNAIIAKFGGGIANDWTNVRALGSNIGATSFKSQGVIPFLKVVNDLALAVDQSGKRRGAACVYLETWHLDIEEFLELRKNTGDERRRTHDLSTANWIPDLFMRRVHEKKSWTLFSPDEVSDLHDLYGKEFDNAYEEYEKQSKLGNIRHYKEVYAPDLWRKMLTMLYETGYPWISFKDTCNIRSPQSHNGVIHCSNLCTEAVLNTSKDEIAACNLGSINLANHINKQGQGIDAKKLNQTIKIAVRALDNAIDVSHYQISETEKANLQHRPIGVGIMGFQDYLYRLNIPYASNEALEISDKIMEQVSFNAIQISSELAVEKGQYPSFKGSFWDKGIMPIDSIALLKQIRGKFLQQNINQCLNWNKLRETIKITGMRNSTVLAIAPTASISNICGVYQSIEPAYQNLFVKSNASGEFTIINSYLIDDLKAINLWNEIIQKKLKYHNGSIQNITEIPEELRNKYQTSFEVDSSWLIEAASRRQKWIDQSQSLNLYINSTSGKKLDIMYKTAWVKGLKTCYYLRSTAASNAENYST